MTNLMHIFNNTEIAFKSRSTPELKKAVWLFRLMSKPLIIRLSGRIANSNTGMKLPIDWLVRPTIFKHFCGGETISECTPVIENLAQFNIGSILDYAAENQHSEEKINQVMHETLGTIEYASKNPAVSFTVFKPSALAPSHVLSSRDNTLNKSGIDKFRNNIKILCHDAHDRGVPILIDAEESHYQEIVDEIAKEMMQLFNKEKVIVYNTLQMYRHDRLDFLNECLEIAKEKNYLAGIKLVRGAYLEQERERAEKSGYPSPLYPDKQSTDNAFNRAMAICLENIDRTSLFVGTHNEESLTLLMEMLEERKLENNDNRVFVSQLYGMSDNISFNMARLSYNVAKYLPYGPVRFLLPYLIRRAEENKSVRGQAGRELTLLNREINRRKKLKKPNSG
jgi:proline dehydrogenase